MGTNDLIENLVELLDSGDEESARLLLQNRDTSAIRDPEFHLGLAKIAEELGEASRAATEYNYALRDNAKNEEALLGLARLRMDMGQDQRAARAYRKLLELDPGHEDAKKELTDLLAGAGTLTSSVDQPANVVIEPTEADKVTFATLFRGREGVYAKQWVSPTGKAGYTPIHEPFTPHVAGKHLLLAITAGIYTVRRDQTVSFLAFDVDLSKRALEKAGKQPGTLQGLIKKTHFAARRIVDSLASVGLTGYIEDSGHKGRHVWVFFNEPVPAKPVRRLGLALVEHSGATSENNITVEVFPRQTRVKQGGLGNLIKLPLGVHRLTTRRCLLLDPDGNPVQDPLGLLRSAQRMTQEQVSRALSSLTPGDPGPKGGGMHASDFDGEEIDLDEDMAFWDGQTNENTSHQHDTGEGISDAPAGSVVESSYDPASDLELLWLIEKCPVLAEIARRLDDSGALTNDERLVITHTIGHLEHGAQAVNHLLGKVLDIDRELFLKSRLKGNPMSCAKIRSKTRHLRGAVDCKCEFEKRAGLYPTPLLHLHELDSRADLPDAKGRTKVSRLRVERMVDDLFKARTEVDRLEQKAEDLEKKLLAIMEEQQVQELNTPGCTLFIDPETKGLAIRLGSMHEKAETHDRAGEKKTAPKLKVVPADNKG